MKRFQCPVCGSPDIYQVAGGYIGQVYVCKKCKYRGSLIIEVDEEEQD
ncbi:hypothetical protein [Methanosphaerula palustris]|nr:hypothetical protein [Methanosphaerula palustris]